MRPVSLTIGIPTRNRGALVAKLVERCLTQTRCPLQIVVSDNASEDDTIKQLERFSHSSLTVIRQSSNVGMIGNWNACLQAAMGDWFVLLSDDDVIAPDFVEHVEKAIAAAPDVDLLFMRCRLLNASTGEVEENYPPVHRGGEVRMLESLLPAWLDGSFNLLFVGMIFRRSYLTATGGFSDKLPFAADVATWLPIAVHRRCSFWPEAKADYVVHPGMATNAYPLHTLIEDVIAIGCLVTSEVGRTALPNREKRRFERLAKRFVRRTFAENLIRATRRGVTKRDMSRAWLCSATRLPRFGFGAMALAAVLVPTSWMDVVGAPYRLWSRHRKASRAILTEKTL